MIYGQTIFIELTNICNFNCIYCPYYQDKKEKGFIKLELINKIVKDLEKIEFIEIVTLSALGEAILHPNIFEICKHLKSNKYKLFLSTNGSRLNSNHLDLDIDIMRISLETLTSEAFNLRNADCSFEEYINNIKDFLKIWNGKYKIFISIMLNDKSDLFDYNSFLNSGNENDAKLVNDFFKEIFPNFHILEKDIKPGKVIEIVPNLQLHFRQIEYSNFIDYEPDITIEELDSQIECRLYRNHINISYDGIVRSCCMDVNHELVIGNIKEQSLKEIIDKRGDNINVSNNPLCRRCKGIKKRVI